MQTQQCRVVWEPPMLWTITILSSLYPRIKSDFKKPFLPCLSDALTHEEIHYCCNRNKISTADYMCLAIIFIKRLSIAIDFFSILVTKFWKVCFTFILTQYTLGLVIANNLELCFLTDLFPMSRPQETEEWFLTT